ncbi:MAG: hypothetical protein SFW62_08690 [Alphaproteobacteria bacterium]|nr:hypothetical protein [Alphaproteobacteria bacterium]
MIEQKTPQLGHVRILKPDDESVHILAGIMESHLQGLLPDEFGEWVHTIRQPLPTPQPYNGGCWFEGFRTIQVPHTHADDGMKASERYILLLPRGADGVVDILPRDLNRTCEGERYVFKKDHLHLLHFNGACPHRFATVGDDPDSVMLAVAFHTRDVATSLQALTEQTTDLGFSMPLPSDNHTYVPPEISSSPFNSRGDADCILRNIDGPEASSIVPAAFYELAETVVIEGKGYGARRFADASSLKRWNYFNIQEDAHRPAVVRVEPLSSENSLA